MKPALTLFLSVFLCANSFGAKLEWITKTTSPLEFPKAREKVTSVVGDGKGNLYHLNTQLPDKDTAPEGLDYQLVKTTATGTIAWRATLGPAPQKTWHHDQGRLVIDAKGNVWFAFNRLDGWLTLGFYDSEGKEKLVTGVGPEMVTNLFSTGNGIYLVSIAGTVNVRNFDETGNQKWKYEATDQLRTFGGVSLPAAYDEKHGNFFFVTPSQKPNAFALDRSGKELWHRTVPSFPLERAIYKYVQETPLAAVDSQGNFIFAIADSKQTTIMANPHWMVFKLAKEGHYWADYLRSVSISYQSTGVEKLLIDSKDNIYILSNESKAISPGTGTYFEITKLDLDLKPIWQSNALALPHEKDNFGTGMNAALIDGKLYVSSYRWVGVADKLSRFASEIFELSTETGAAKLIYTHRENQNGWSFRPGFLVGYGSSLYFAADSWFIGEGDGSTDRYTGQVSLLKLELK